MHHFSDQVWLRHGHTWASLLVLLLPFHTALLRWCLCSSLDSPSMWLRLTFPGKCCRRAQACPFSLTASVNQHTYQGHLACLSCCFTSTWTLLRPRSALPAGERQGISNVVQTCTHTYACPRPKSSLPAGLRLENTLWDAKRDCRITGLCGTTGDWSFSSDPDNCCAERMREESLPNSVPPSSDSQSPSVCSERGLQLVGREPLIPSLCGGSDQSHSFAPYHPP